MQYWSLNYILLKFGQFFTDFHCEAMSPLRGLAARGTTFLFSLRSNIAPTGLRIGASVFIFLRVAFVFVTLRKSENAVEIDPCLDRNCPNFSIY